MIRFESDDVIKLEDFGFLEPNIEIRSWKLEHIYTLLECLSDILKSFVPSLHITLVSNISWFYPLYINFLVLYCQGHNETSSSLICITTTTCRRLAENLLFVFLVFLHTIPYSQEIIHISHWVELIQTNLLYCSEISSYVWM